MQRVSASERSTVALVMAIVVVVGALLVLGQRGSGSPDDAAPPVPPTGSPTDLPVGPSTPVPTTAPPTAPTGVPPLTPTGPPTSAAPGDPRPPDQEVCVVEYPEVSARVLVLNMKAGQVAGLEPVARLVEQSGADVVLLQEVDQGIGRTGRVDQPQVLGARLDMHYTFGASISFGGGDYGLAILSRWPITSAVSTPLPNRAGREQRALLHAVLDVDGAPVSMYTTHLEAGIHDASLRVRQVRRILDVLAADPRPAVLGGDLNATPGTAEVGLLRTALVDTFDAVGTGSGATVPSAAPRYRIDFAMHRPGLVTATSSVVLAQVVSDHRGILSQLVVPAGGERTCVDVPLPPPVP